MVACLVQRLLTDNSPRLREALRYTVYGKSGVFDVDRFIDIMEAFETFTDQAKTGVRNHNRPCNIGRYQDQPFKLFCNS